MPDEKSVSPHSRDRGDKITKFLSNQYQGYVCMCVYVSPIIQRTEYLASRTSFELFDLLFSRSSPNTN